MPIRHNEASLTGIGRCGHQARSVGEGMWVVSYLPGRTLTRAQARAALRVADELDDLSRCAAVLGLTLLEIVGLATMDSSGQRAFSHQVARRVLSQLGETG